MDEKQKNLLFMAIVIIACLFIGVIMGMGFIKSLPSDCDCSCGMLKVLDSKGNEIEAVCTDINTNNTKVWIKLDMVEEISKDKTFIVYR